MESRSKGKTKGEEGDAESPDMIQRLIVLETKVLQLQSELRLVKRKLRTAEDSHSTATINRILKDILRKQQFTMTLCPNSDEIQITNILAMGGNWAQGDSDPDKTFVPLDTDRRYGDGGSDYDHQPTTQMETNESYGSEHSESDSDASWNESGTKARNKRKRKQGGVGPKSKKPGRAIPNPQPATTFKKPKQIPVIELSDQNQEPTSDSETVSPKTTPKKSKRKRESNHDGTIDLVEMKKQFQLLLREKVEEDPELGPSQILENFLASLPPDIDPDQCAKMESIKRGIRRIRQQIRTPGGSEDSS